MKHFPSFLIATLFATLLAAPMARAALQCVETNGIKVMYPPNVNGGWDVKDSRNGIVLADDFKCIITGPVTDIHIWGSWLNDDHGVITNFWIGIYDDVPAVTNVQQGQIMPSHPGNNLLWQQSFGPGQFAEDTYAQGSESFYNPTNKTFPGGDSMVWYYCFYPTNPFVQQGTAAAPTTYWLAVYAQLGGQAQQLFGWKTSTSNYNDAAVWGTVANGLPVGNWQSMTNVQTQQPINLAFKLTTPTNKPPLVVNCSSNITAMATSGSGAIVNYTVTISGGCSPITTNCVPPSGAMFPVGVTSVNCSATDSCDQSNACSFTVTVLRPPLTITCSTNISVTTVNPSGAVVNYAVTVSGGCPPITTNCLPPSGSTFPIGITTVNCNAKDSCGQSNACSFTVTVNPSLLAITCPSNLTVHATSAAGAVVSYPAPTVSGGCPPITTNCVPPSGSTFPIGTTVVNCTATDVCGGQANCSFTVTVLRQLKKHFFQHNLLPPENGLYVPPTPGAVTFPGGIIISNVAHRVFSASVAPPSVGGNVTNSFNSQVEMNISFDGGLTWQSCVVSNAPTRTYAINNGLDSGDALYGGELQQLNLSGGTLPAGVVIRESPTKASSGETRIETIPGGYMIDSFFDIYLEISTDGGSTYMPAGTPLRLELKPDPQLIAPALAPRKVMPMPNGQDITPSAWWQLYANGIVIKDVRHKLYTGWMEPPVFSASQTHTFDSQLDFQLSTDGGSHFTAARAPATMTVSWSNVRGFQGRSTYDTEVTQLDVAGGDLPVGVMIRESPTKASKGGTSQLAGGGGGGAGGGAAISSFFDIFTEVSTDGGASWNPATNGPAHMETRRIAPVYTYTNNLFPPLAGQYYCPQQWFAYYANGIVITNFLNHAFTAAITPPLPGFSTSHTFGSTVEFDISYDGGLTYTHTITFATDGVQLTGRLGDDGVTEYYDTEMTQLSISGGGLPSNIQIRESPTKASLGRTTMSANGTDNDCDSFFDIFTEVSTDGGFSWYPTIAGPGTVMLRPRAPSSPLTITCPSNLTVHATSAAGAVVSYPAPTVSGGCPPITTNCVPPSGSTFPIGTTVVNCTATDVCGGQANCSFQVTVLGPIFVSYVATNRVVLTWTIGILQSTTNLLVPFTDVAGAMSPYTNSTLPPPPCRFYRLRWNSP